MVLLAPVEAMIHWFVTWNSFNFQRNFKSLKRKKKGQNISLKCHPNITWRLHRCCSVGKQNIPASFLWDVLMQGAGMKRMINFLGNIRRKMLCVCQFQILPPPGQHGAFDFCGQESTKYLFVGPRLSCCCFFQEETEYMNMQE